MSTPSAESWPVSSCVWLWSCTETCKDRHRLGGTTTVHDKRPRTVTSCVELRLCKWTTHRPSPPVWNYD